MKKRKVLTKILSVVLSIIMLMQLTAVYALDVEGIENEDNLIISSDDTAGEVAVDSEGKIDIDALRTLYLSESEQANRIYPDGFYLLPIDKADIYRGEKLEIPVFRQGGAENEAEITVSFLDLNAKYGIDYLIYATDDESEPMQINEDALSVFEASDENVVAVPVVGELDKEETDEEQESISTQDIVEENEQATDQNRAMLDTLGAATEIKLNFAVGEREKSFFIKTLSTEEPKGNLNFMAVISEVSAGVIAQSAKFTASIIDERETEESKVWIEAESEEVLSSDEYVGFYINRTGNLYQEQQVRFKTVGDYNIHEGISTELIFAAGVKRINVLIALEDENNDGGEVSGVISELTGGEITETQASVTVKPDADAPAIFPSAAQQRSIATFTQSNEVVASAELGSAVIESEDKKELYIQLDKWNHMTTGIDKVVMEQHKNSVLIGAKSTHPSIMRSPDMIDFAGIQYLQFDMEGKAGNLDEDDYGPFIGTSIPSNESAFNSILNSSNGKWFNAGSLKQKTKQWDVTHINSVEYLNFGALPYDKGHWCNVWNYYTNNECKLIKKEYDLKLKDPDKLTKLNSSGEYISVSPVVPSFLGGGKHVETYRDWQHSLTMDIADKDYDFVGFNLYKTTGSTTESKPAHFIETSIPTITITGDFIRQYNDCIKDGTIMMQPVFKLRQANITVNPPKIVNTNYIYTITSGNANTAGTATYTGPESLWQANIEWGNNKASERGYYNFGDGFSISAEMTNSSAPVDIVGYWIYQADTETALKENSSQEYKPVKNLDITIKSKYVHITPVFEERKVGIGIDVSNSTEFSSFTGKTQESNSFDWFIDPSTGGLAESGDIVMLEAKVNDEHDQKIAKWEYKDVVTNQNKVFYGEYFYYEVQSAVDYGYNTIKLSTEDVGGTATLGELKNRFTAQKATILEPDNWETVSASGTLVGHGEYFAVVNDDGIAKRDPNISPDKVIKVPKKENAQITTIIRYNNKEYVAEITPSDAGKDVNVVTSTGAASMKIDVISQTRVGERYGKSIPLVLGEVLRFELSIREMTNTPITAVEFLITKENGEIVQSQNVSKTGASLVFTFTTSSLGAAEIGGKILVQLTDSRGVSHGYVDTGYVLVEESNAPIVAYFPEEITTPDVNEYDVPLFGNYVNKIPTSKRALNTYSSTTMDSDTGIVSMVYGFSVGKLNPDSMSAHTKMSEKIDAFKAAKTAAGANGKEKGVGVQLSPFPKLSINVDAGIEVTGIIGESGGIEIYDGVMFAAADVLVSFNIPVYVGYIPTYVFVEIQPGMAGAFRLCSAITEADGRTVKPIPISEAGDFDNWMFQAGSFESQLEFKGGAGIGINGVIGVNGFVYFDVNYTVKTGPDEGGFRMDAGFEFDLFILSYPITFNLVDISLVDEPQSKAGLLSTSILEENLDISNIKLQDLKLPEKPDTTNSISSRSVPIQSGLKIASDVAYEKSKPYMMDLGDGKMFVIFTEPVFDNNGLIREITLKYSFYDAMLDGIPSNSSSEIDVEKLDNFKVNSLVDDIITQFAGDDDEGEIKRILGVSDDEYTRLNFDPDLTIVKSDDSKNKYLIISWVYTGNEYYQGTPYDCMSNLELIKSANICAVPFDIEEKKFLKPMEIAADPFIGYYNPTFVQNKKLSKDDPSYLLVTYNSIDDTKEDSDNKLDPDKSTLEELSKLNKKTTFKAFKYNEEKDKYEQKQEIKDMDLIPSGKDGVVQNISIASYKHKAYVSYLITSLDNNGKNKSELYMKIFSSGSDVADYKSYSDAVKIFDGTDVVNPTFIDILVEGEEDDEYENYPTLFFKSGNSLYQMSLNDAEIHALAEAGYDAIRPTGEDFICTPISFEEHTEIGDDINFSLVGDGYVYALWTVPKYIEQQIYGATLNVDKKKIDVYYEKKENEIIKYEDITSLDLSFNRPTAITTMEKDEGFTGGALNVFTSPKLPNYKKNPSIAAFDVDKRFNNPEPQFPDYAGKATYLLYTGFETNASTKSPEEELKASNYKIYFQKCVATTGTVAVADGKSGTEEEKLLLSNDYPRLDETINVSAIIRNEGLTPVEQVQSTYSMRASGEKHDEIWEKYFVNENGEEDKERQLPILPGDETELHFSNTINQSTWDEIKNPNSLKNTVRLVLTDDYRGPRTEYSNYIYKELKYGARLAANNSSVAVTKGVYINDEDDKPSYEVNIDLTNTGNKKLDKNSVIEVYASWANPENNLEEEAVVLGSLVLNEIELDETNHAVIKLDNVDRKYFLTPVTTSSLIGETTYELRQATNIPVFVRVIENPEGPESKDIEMSTQALLRLDLKDITPELAFDSDIVMRVGETMSVPVLQNGGVSQNLSELTYQSTAGAVVSVNNAGIISADSIGESTISAENGKYDATTKVTVLSENTRFIVVDENINNGTITPSADIKLKDESVIFTISPNNGYELDTLYINGVPVSVTEETFEYTLMDDDIFVSATFKTKVSPGPGPGPEPSPDEEYIAEEKDGQGTLDISDSQAESIIKELENSKDNLIVIDVTSSENIDEITVNMPQNLIDSIASSKGTVEFSTTLGDITLSNMGATELQGKGNVSLSLGKTDDGFLVDIKQNGKEPEMKAGSVMARIPVKLEDGNVVAIKNADGTQTIISNCLVGKDNFSVIISQSAELVLVKNEKAFVDTKEHWAKADIEATAARELFLGVTDTEFRPSASMTRGMVVTVLHRLDEATAASNSSDFTDVESGVYYYDAVNWAAENGIVLGMGDDTYEPNRTVTREQLVTIIYRYLQYKGYNMDYTEKLDDFIDVEDVSNYAFDAMCFMVENGIIIGRTENEIYPKDFIKRAEVSVIIMRIIRYMHSNI